MRYAETLLIFAEADNEVNNGPSAEALNIISQLNTRNNSSTVIDRNKKNNHLLWNLFVPIYWKNGQRS